MGIKIILLIIFFAVMAAVGIYSRRHVTSVDGFVLGGRSVGPWLTAFAYGTSYFSYMDRHRKCINRKPSGMGSSRKAYKSDDTASWIKDDAGFFRRTVQEQIT